MNLPSPTPQDLLAEPTQDGGPPLGVLSRIVASRAVRAALPLVLGLLAYEVLRRLSADVHPRAIAADVRSTSPATLLLALLATTASFLAIAGCDRLLLPKLATRPVPGAVPLATGAAASAVSGLLGLALLTAGAVRYRVYSAFGLDAAAVGRLIATIWAGYLVSAAALLGGALAVDPGVLARLGVPEVLARALGLGLLAALALVVAHLARGRRHLGLGWASVEVPDLGTLLRLALLSGADMAAAAFVLWVLLPADLGVSYPHLLVVFLVAVLLGVASHAPGGLGVFEASIVAGLGAAGQSQVLAALIVYRAVYTLLPFAVAAAGLAVAWWLGGRDASGWLAWLHDLVRPAVPGLMAGLALLSGMVLLVSGSLPSDPSRLVALRGVLPLPVIETSHLLGSVVGLLLLVVARGLWRRLARAWTAAVWLLAAGLLVSLVKGIDWEEALAMGAALLVLAIFRDAFPRGGTDLLRLTPRWIATLTLLVVGMAWIGSFAYRHVPYADDLWWRFAWTGDASRFLRATLAVAVLLAAVSLASLIGRRVPPLPPEPIPDAVRRLVAEAPDTEPALALLGDKRFVVDERSRAFLSYADTGATLVSKGDPVGEPSAGAELVWRLREMADRMGRRCAFYAVTERFLPAYLDLGYQILKIGEIARVELAGFSLEGSHRKEWRRAVAKAGREGLSFAILPPAELAPRLEELRAVSDAWLAMKQGTEKAFALGYFDPGYLLGFDTAVMRDGEGRILAFANLLRSGGREELSVDLMRHRPEAPGVVMDALFAEIMLRGKAEGYRWFSLGAAPLAGLEARPLAPTWTWVGAFLYAHGERFYHFEGLRSFKQKFDPVWSPNYLACASRLEAPRILLEVNRLISGGVRGLLRRSGGR